MTVSYEKNDLFKRFENECLPKIYGFCRMKLGNAAEAEDMAQDIAYEVLKAMDAGKEIDNLGAFVRSVSNHVFCNRLRRKRRGGQEVTYVDEIILNTVASDEDVPGTYARREQLALLRRELALMSGNYRRAVVMHYFDGLSCEEIAAALGRSAGTVKWWLHDAREAIKEGMETMRQFGEKSYRPGALFMSCQGTLGTEGQPVKCAARRSAQNILLAAYREPMTVEELCIETGIPAVYVEDEVRELVRQELMREVTRGRYQTDFVILPNGKSAELAVRIDETYASSYADALLSWLEEHREALCIPAFNTSGYSWERLLWVYIHLFGTWTISRYLVEDSIGIRYEQMPLRPDGGRWIGLGYDNSPSQAVPAVLRDRIHDYDGPVHKNDGGVQGFFHEWSGFDSSVYFSLPSEVFGLCRRVVRDGLDPSGLGEEDKYLFSLALEHKLFLRDGEGFYPTFCYFTAEAWRALSDMVDDLYSRLAPIYRATFKIVLDAYKPDIPVHLHPQMGNFLSNLLNGLIPDTFARAMKRGILSAPESEGNMWLSLLMTEV